MDKKELNRIFSRNNFERNRNIEEEKRETSRLEPVEQIIARNSECHTRAQAVNATSDAQKKPVVILGKSENTDCYFAADVHADTRMEQGSFNASRAVINFYSLTEDQAHRIQNFPLIDKTRESKTFGQWIGQEQALAIDYRLGCLPGHDIKLHLGEFTNGKAFNLIGSIVRAVRVRKASAELDRFAQSLDMVETAMINSSLNPQLAQLIVQSEATTQVA
jgi:hypothetical protein